MRKHGWQLPYHPLQIVAVSVFTALGFAFYVFFAPFVGRKLFQYIAIGLYTPLILSVFSLYIWCAASDPADSGVFKSKKYINTHDSKKPNDESSKEDIRSARRATELPRHPSWAFGLLALIPCASLCNKCSNPHEESTEQQLSEDGMFYCSLCEVEVFRYSKHCRVCDKCVDRFDHHCRWINNCIGKRNYKMFFTLMVFALLLLILQWSTGILVLICCFIDNKRFSVDITSKLGSSFSVVPFVIVVVICTLLAMVATLPLVQLFFFHILLMKKGISTYDYIIALREQEQGTVGGGQQSPQMSTASSMTGLSSVSSMNTFHRAAWCTPPRLFVEDQFDVVPPDTGSVSSFGKKTLMDEPMKKKTAAPVKISPWTLARLNAEDVSKAAAEARKKSKILQPVVRREEAKRDNGSRRRASKRVRLTSDRPFEPDTTKSSDGSVYNLIRETSTSFAPLRIEPRGAFLSNLAAVSSSTVVVGSSPESSLDSPDLHPFPISNSGIEDARRMTCLSAASAAALKGIPLSGSASDGYEASGGEDSDRVPYKFEPRSMNYNSVFVPDQQQQERMVRLKGSTSSSLTNIRSI
ncbi:probable protein S-acyltransferase 22 [Impatiens glandulifera]|uniref:probable protein S-acyltransferase 22 n=1 Tax=Impatiens glandulifera TaxID=253017 RepID=UPI001FB1859C|nr:probable protein S-acyltransferase 22 [Impatiens glandulifera]